MNTHFIFEPPLYYIYYVVRIKIILVNVPQTTFQNFCYNHSFIDNRKSLHITCVLYFNINVLMCVYCSGVISFGLRTHAYIRGFDVVLFFLCLMYFSIFILYHVPLLLYIVVLHSLLCVDF